ncbi:NO-inducible flavohemoprotein [Niallia sp. Sow4_A1]|jgi:nitric oxide dioxygenase|uniref:NO-inducible flavohemoprotein n=1 Tax=Bacillaceae TaxID=186817 RepID=UPI0004E21B27|nr:MULTISPECIES: NO-inducible flavohemoprotein [Bacillaceae]MCF2647301.1 NO-inducible flavohemoprotein [Niallia circulans]MCM3361124.1 NO-inducible flavohemoprotein [Niallia sp. MER TA 168]CAI9390267.1 Flavohemoprotein [Bacillus sp. T2.9-1]
MLSQKTMEIIKSTVPVLQVHGTQITTVFYKNMFSAHPELLNIFNHANQAKGRQQTALANTVLAAAQNIDRLETIIPVVKQIAHKHRSLMIKAEHYPIVGEFLLKAIKEVLGDAATDEIIQAWADAYGAIAQVFIDIEKQMYEESATKSGGWSDYKEFKIIKKVKESDVITSFYLAPADGSSLPAYEAGQYITIRLSIPGEKFLFNRQYSLSSASNKEYFRISVKKEASVENPDGKVSNYLHSDINVDDTLEVTVPAGDFTLIKEESPIVFISGGVGITPFMSMVATIAEEQPNRKVNFIHSARNGAIQAFNEELISIKDRITNFQLSYIYENPTEKDKLNPFFKKAGYIDSEWLKESAIVAEGDYYVCGPVPFLQTVVKGLKDNGIDDAHIHYEFFGPSLKL